MNNFCPNCGNKVDSNSYVCINCGVKLQNDIQTTTINNDKGGFGWSVLGFFVPLVGLILYLVWNNDKPNTAKDAGKGALAYVIVYFVIMFIFFTIGFIGDFVDGIEEDNSYNDYYYDFE